MKRLSGFALFALLTTMVLPPGARAQFGSVIMPDNSLDATMILDEAGAAQSLNADGANLQYLTWAVVDESTINAPTSGYVLAIASGTAFAFTHHSGERIDMEIGVSDDCDASPSPDNIHSVHLQRLVPNSSRRHIPFSMQKIFDVSAGDQTFCIVGVSLFLYQDTHEDIGVENLSLSLLFIPSAYGPLDQ